MLNISRRSCISLCILDRSLQGLYYDVCKRVQEVINCHLLAFPQDFLNVLSNLFVGFIFHVNQNLFSIVCQDRFVTMYERVPFPTTHFHNSWKKVF